MSRFSFFLDLDDTVIKSKTHVASYLSNKYGVTIRPEDLVDNNGFHNTLNSHGVNVSYNEVYLDFGKNFFSSFSLQDFSLYPGAKEAIVSLSRFYNLYIVTSRQKNEKPYIEEILKYHEILSCFRDIHCVWDWKDGSFVSEPKASFIEEKRKTEVGVCFVDDSIEEIQRIAKSNLVISRILFDPQRSYSKEGIGFEVFNNWGQVKKMFA